MHLQNSVIKFFYTNDFLYFSVLLSLGKHHIGSFNYMLDEGLKLAVQDLDPLEFVFDPTGQYGLWLDHSDSSYHMESKRCQPAWCMRAKLSSISVYANLGCSY